VSAAGIVLPLPLSHDLLGQLTAARRPTVTLALGKLEQAGQLRRRDDGSWLLTEAAEHAVKVIAKTKGNARAFGDSLALRLEGSETREQARALRAQAKLMRTQPGLTRYRRGQIPRSR
jgi:hypothetical protein